MRKSKILPVVLCVAILFPNYSHGGIWDELKQRSQGAMETAKNAGASAWSATERQASIAADKAGTALQSAKQSSKELWRTTKSQANVAIAKSEDLYREAKTVTTNAIESGKSTVVQAVDQGRKVVQQTRHTVNEKLHGARDQAISSWRQTVAAYNSVTASLSGAWSTTAEFTRSGYQATKSFIVENGPEIAATVIVTAVTYALSKGPAPSSGRYGHLPDATRVGPGKTFTQAQKAQILDANRVRNGGMLRSDLSGMPLSVPQRHHAGYRPPLNEAHVDHINPRSAGGTNSPGNAQVLSRQENLLKGATK